MNPRWAWPTGESGEALTPDHLFRIASVTKPITSSAIFDLIERGKVKLTDRVFGRGAVLGTRFGRAPYGRWIEDITVEHLLTHTAGGWQNDGTDPMFRNPTMDHAALIGWTLNTLPLSHPPGAAYAYSNFGFCVLGRVIEVLSGQPGNEDAVHDRILDPCGNHRMRLAGNTLKDRESLEVRYYGQGDDNPYNMNVRRIDSHGGWLATAGNLATFAMHVDGFKTTPNILTAATIHTMVTPDTREQGLRQGVERECRQQLVAHRQPARHNHDHGAHGQRLLLGRARQHPPTQFRHGPRARQDGVGHGPSRAATRRRPSQAGAGQPAENASRTRRADRTCGGLRGERGAAATRGSLTGGRRYFGVRVICPLVIGPAQSWRCTAS